MIKNFSNTFKRTKESRDNYSWSLEKEFEAFFKAMDEVDTSGLDDIEIVPSYTEESIAFESLEHNEGLVEVYKLTDEYSYMYLAELVECKARPNAKVSVIEEVSDLLYRLLNIRSFSCFHDDYKNIDLLCSTCIREEV